MFFLLSIYFVVGVIFITISIPLIKRKVKINNWYGVRLPQTMKNEKIWYEVNEKSGRHLFIFGVVICILSVILFLGEPFAYNVTAGVMTAIILIGTIILVFKAISITNKLSKTK